jgi:hypothetical protein
MAATLNRRTPARGVCGTVAVAAEPARATGTSGYGDEEQPRAAASNTAPTTGERRRNAGPVGAGGTDLEGGIAGAADRRDSARFDASPLPLTFGGEARSRRATLSAAALGWMFPGRNRKRREQTRSTPKSPRFGNGFGHL